MSNWFTETRVAWIIEMVEIFGFINRKHVIAKFGISKQQVASDFRVLLEMRPGLMTYNDSTKRYEIDARNQAND